MIAIIVASKDFRDEEYFIPLEIFSLSDKVVTFSDRKGLIIGADGGEAIAEEEIKNLHPEKFSVVVFIGGPGCLKHLDNEESYRIAKETRGVLGAICISPVILAKAGVLDGVRATVWSSSMERSPVRILKENGALYEDLPVVKDGLVLTSKGPQFAEQFAKEVLLTKKEKRL